MSHAPAPTKWLDDCEPSSPAIEVARKAISRRIRAVEYYLPKAADDFEQDVEYVHQLRVSTRRAAAALNAFQMVLPKSGVKKVKRHLKTIRKSAGAARDLDVFRNRLVSEKLCLSLEQTQALLTSVDEAREKAQVPLREVAATLPPKRLKKLRHKLIKEINRTSKDAQPQPSYASMARQTLTTSIEMWLDSAGVLDTACIDTIHQLRIEGKRLRYSIELYAVVCQPVLRQKIYPRLCELQNVFGRLNDFAASQELLAGWERKNRDSVERAAIEQMAAFDGRQFESSLQQASELIEDTDFLALGDEMIQTLPGET